MCTYSFQHPRLMDIYKGYWNAARKISALQHIHLYSSGLQISGGEAPLTLGTTATLTCTYDLTATVMEWVYDGQILVHTSGHQADLVLSFVNDSLHGRHYTCRAISPFGIEHSTVTIAVSGKVTKSIE